MSEKIAIQQKHKADIAQAQSNLDHWKNIAATQQRRAEQTASAKAAARKTDKTGEIEADGNETETQVDAAPRQENKEGDEKVKLSEEIDENGRQFVLTPNGELAFGEIGEETGLTAAPILLSEGMITNPVTNDGYGLAHIEARHGDQIRATGYKSVVDFILTVAQNYDTIREGNVRDGHQTYRL